MLASQEIRALIIALGTAIADEFDLSKLRYHKIIITVDSDTDGSHIRTLLLTLFYRYFRELIEAGHLYIATPPLYRIQKGKEVQYAYNDKEKEKVLNELRRSAGKTGKQEGGKRKKKNIGKIPEGWEVSEIGTDETAAGGNGTMPEEETKITGVSIQRYKGLGEMNPDQLWETTMDPEKRTLLQVTIEDAQEADKIFDILMGSDVLPRKKFIQAHAKDVKNLDI